MKTIRIIASHKWTRRVAKVWAWTAGPKWAIIGISAAKKAGLLSPVLVFMGF